MRSLSCDIRASDAVELAKTLESKSVKLVLTDPPFGIHLSTLGERGFSGVYNSHTEQLKQTLDWDEIPFDYASFLEETKRILHPNGSIIIFFDVFKMGLLKDEMERLGFNNIRLLTWKKTNPALFKTGPSGYLPAAFEHALFAMRRTGRDTIDNAPNHSGLFEHQRPNRRSRGVYSYAQKPIPLLKELIRRHSVQGDLVFDPYLGSGSTAEAAMYCERRFVGGDINPDFVQTIKQQIYRQHPNALLVED